MTIFLSILAAGLYAGLLLLLAMRPHASQLTHYELERRAHVGDAAARRQLRRLQLAGGMDGILLAARLLAGVFMAALFAAALGGWAAVVLSCGLLVLAVPLARVRGIRAPAQRLYDRYEAAVLRLLDARPHVARWFHLEASQQALHIGSPEELAHVIDQAGAHLSREQQKLLQHSLRFDDLTVSEVMTRKGEIDTIDRRELLGPLVLDDLHKTGHSVFPVTDGGVDYVVGVLSIAGFLSLDSKRSITAEKAMTPHVERISETASLRQAMQQFVRSHQHLLIVVNDARETVGVLSLHDVMTALFGR